MNDWVVFETRVTGVFGDGLLTNLNGTCECGGIFLGFYVWSGGCSFYGCWLMGI